jgi:site-specific DNA-methyltransferase (adenine-specific)
MRLINGEALEEMDKLIAEGITVDAIICDPPYGTTQNKWDSVISFDAMWERLNKLIKPNGAIVLFGSEPFSSALRMSNIKKYKYDWVWDKKRCTGFLNSKKQPLRNHELISVFYNKKPIYNPQPYKKNTIGNMGNSKESQSNNYGSYKTVNNENLNETGYPRTIIAEIGVINNLTKDKTGFHPTQKPVALMEYLIKTYTNEGETVLDFTMGSGSTLVACSNTNRRGIGIEMDKGYFDIAVGRVEAIQ